MPDYFTHFIGALEIYEKLEGKYRNAITDKALYLLGAQGGDVFFFYGLSYKHNAGRYLHTLPAAEIFEKLMQKDRSYCAGWATHYALDSRVHPQVYAYESSHNGTFLHRKFENDLGLYVSRKSGMRRMIVPREKVLACTPAVCDSMRPLLPFITPSGVYACLKRHFLYSRTQFNAKKQQFVLPCDYSAAYSAYLDGMEAGARAVACVLDGTVDSDVFSANFLEGRAAR